MNVVLFVCSYNVCTVILLNTKYILIFINIKMTQYNSLNVKLSNSWLNKFKSAKKKKKKKKWNRSSF